MENQANESSKTARAAGILLALGCVAIQPLGGQSVQAALLDGIMAPVERKLADEVAEKGERLVTGNFYDAERPDAHGPMGTMREHTHNQGEFMFTYRYSLMRMAGNRSGTSGVSEADVLENFMVTPTDMTTQMHMFMPMYGVNNTLTAMVMVPYIIKSMDHVRRMGSGFSTSSEGFGDIALTTLWRLWAAEAPSIGSHRFHMNVGLSFPTGSVSKRGDTPAGNIRLPYPMQLGTGTYNVSPGLTYMGAATRVSWGAQYTAWLPIGRNSENYSVGDRHQAWGYGAYRWADWLSTSVRFNYNYWKNYDGRDPNIVGSVPTADPNLRGGERVDFLLGANILFPEIMHLENRIGIEGGFPIYQDLKGPQLESDYTFFVGWQLVH